MKPVEIESVLKKYLPKGGDALSRAMRYSVFSGGKRIRPILTIESSKACGGNLKDVLPAACAIELVHTYSLIHDDLPAMDNDDFRRGKPTCHKMFGEASAILAGDALLTLAFNIIASKSKPVIGMKIIRELSDAIGANGMVAGQALDLEFQVKFGTNKGQGAPRAYLSEPMAPESRRRPVGPEARIKTGQWLKEIDLLKTAKLFSAAAKIGALTAGAQSNKIRALEQFGLDFGLSFQIVDDYLDGEGPMRRKSIASLIEKANSDLKVFGPNARGLRNMIEYLSRRER